jgi:peptide deformylase
VIYPIYTYGQPVLRKVAEPISADYPDLKSLIDNLFETLHHAEGVGLAAPQIGLSIRLIVIDLSPYAESRPEFKNFKKALINAEIVERSDEEEKDEEGCLSLPGIHEYVPRSNKVVIRYLDENFAEHTETYEGYIARVIQHEYDHLDGHLYIDHISPIRRQLIKGKLLAITKGTVNCNYKIKTVK